MSMLSIEHLSAAVNGSDIIKNISLTIDERTTHVLLGPNGSGKSTLAYTLAGHPRYVITGGSAHLDAHEITAMTPDRRARAGLFLAVQHSPSISGVSLFTFLKEACTAVQGSCGSLKEFKEKVLFYCDLLRLDRSCLERPLYEGFSGGEKKRCEMLQLLLLKPKMAILDEIDSGLDIDALKQLITVLDFFKQDNPHSALLIITHNLNLAQLLCPDGVHGMYRGVLVRSGRASLIDELADKGYDAIIRG